MVGWGRVGKGGGGVCVLANMLVCVPSKYIVVVDKVDSTGVMWSERGLG